MLKFCNLAWTLCWQDIQERFAGSLLGSLWVFIWPLLQLAVYILIFGKIMGARLGMNQQIYAYGMYIAAGLLGWTCFANALAKSSRSLLDRRGIIRKVKISLAVFPAAACLGELLPFAGGFTLLFLIDLGMGWAPKLHWLVLVTIALYALVTLAYGLGLFFACLAAFSRDVVELVTITLQLAFWFTPIVYLPTILPVWLANCLWLNPMTGITRTFQQCFVLGGTVEWLPLIYSVCISQLAMCGGLALWHHWEKDLRDVL